MISRSELEAMSAEELHATLQRVSDDVSAKLASRASELSLDGLVLVDESDGDAFWLAVKEMAAAKADDANRVTHALAALEYFARALR
ncbi:MAG: hypothetical protein ACO1OB_11875 [Archangium sp.]